MSKLDQTIAIAGAAETDLGALPHLSEMDLRVDAAHRALADAGLTAFFIDMKSLGIEVRRIRQISGTSNFCEVFFADLRVPDAQRLGEVGGGWKVALTTLMNERLAVGDAPRPGVDDLLALVRTTELDGVPSLTHPAVRERACRAWQAASSPSTGTSAASCSTSSRWPAARPCCGCWTAPTS